MLKRFIVLSLVALLTAGIAPQSASPAGIDLATAKAQGLVGERPDGLIGIVDPSAASAEVKALVESTNEERRKKYAAIAAKNGTTIDKVQAVAGAGLIKRTPPGQYVTTASGTWIKKK